MLFKRMIASMICASMLFSLAPVYRLTTASAEENTAAPEDDVGTEAIVAETGTPENIGQLVIPVNSSAEETFWDEKVLKARDGDDRQQQEGQFLIPYVQFQLPTKEELSGVDVEGAKIRMYVSENNNTEAANYFVAYSKVNGMPDIADGIPVFSPENTERPINYRNMLYYELGKNSNGREWFHMLPLKIPNTETEIPAGSDQWVEFDVTEKIKELVAGDADPGDVVFAICFESGGNYQSEIHFCSQECDDPELKPQLVLDMSGAKRSEISSSDDLTLTTDGKDVEGKTHTIEADKSETYLTFDLNEIVEGMSDGDVELSEMNLSLNVEEVPENNQTTVSVDLVEPYDRDSISWDNKPEVVTAGVDSMITMDMTAGSKITFDLLSAANTVLSDSRFNNKMTLRISASSYFEMGNPLVISSSRKTAEELRPSLSYTLKYNIEEMISIAPGGKTSIDIPSDGSITSRYSLMLVDQKGGKIPGGSVMPVEWSIEGNPDGVSIDQDGMLTVSSDAASGEITIRVTRADDKAVTGTLTVDLKKDAARSLRIVGPDGLAIPESGETTVQKYTAQLFDENGTQLPESAVVWEIEPPTAGVEISQDGTLTITDSNILPATQITVKATLASNTDCSDAQEIELSKAVYVSDNYYIPTSQEHCVQKNGSTQNTSNYLLAKQHTANGNFNVNNDYFGVNSTNRESYLQFRGITDIQEIKKATLYLTIGQEGTPTSRYTDLYKMPDEWTASNSRVSGVTDSEMTKIGTADYDWTPDSQISFDVTDVLKEKVESKASAFSVRVAMQPVNNNSSNQAFYSSNNTSVTDEQKPHIALEGTVIPKVAGIRLDGPELLEIGESEQTATYKAILTNRFGKDFSDEDTAAYDINLEMTSDVQGVSFNGETCELTISPTAKDGIVVLQAYLSNRPDIKATINIQVYKSELSEITVTRTDANDRSIVIPSSGETSKITVRADCFDQYNNLLEREAGDITFSLSQPVLGVEVDEATGETTIYDYAVPGREVTIVATSKSSPTISGRFGAVLISQATPTTKERPFLLYDSKDLPEIRQKVNDPFFTSFYDGQSKLANTYTLENLEFMMKDFYHDDPAYPDSGKQIHKTAWQDMVSMFDFFEPFAFTPPSNAKYVKLQVLAQGQGVTRFDNVSMNIVRGDTAEVPNESFETGGSSPEQWDFVIANEVLDENGNPTGKDSKGRDVAADFVWENQDLFQEKVASDGKRSVRIDNKTPYTRAGVQSDFIPVEAGAQYNANVWFGANEKLVGEKGPLPDYDDNGNLDFKPLDDTAGVGMVALYYDENYNLIGSWDYKNQRGYNIINWQVTTGRLVDNLQADAVVYAVEQNKNNAEKAKIELMMAIDDMIYGSAYIRVGGKYNHKFRDCYEAVHLGRHLTHMIFAYDMIYDSGVITPEDDAKIKDGLTKLVEKLMDKSYFNYEAQPKYNFNADRMSAILAYALAFPDDAVSEKFWDHCMNESYSWSVPSVLQNAVWESGAWNESFRYGGNVLGLWIPIFVAIDRVKPELDILNHPKFKQMFECYVNLQSPRNLASTTTPGFASYLPTGDMSWGELSTRFCGMGAYIYAEKDPELSRQLMYTWERIGSPIAAQVKIGALLHLDDDLESERPALGSMYLKDDKDGKFGQILFRQNFDVLGKENFLQLSNSALYCGGRSSGSTTHDHNDRGNIQLFANSTPMIIDLSVGGYIASDTNYYRNTRPHSVIQFKNGNNYENNSGRDNVDSETMDTYFSQTLDYAAVKVNKNDSSKTFTRHIAYVKNGIDAYVMWDEIDGTKDNTNNLYVVSTDMTQDGSTITAKCHNNMDLEILSLAPQNPDITVDWAPVSPGNPGYGIPLTNGQELVQHLEYGQGGGKDYITVLYPKTSQAESLKQEQIDSGTEGVNAFKLSRGNDYFYTVINETDKDSRVSLGNTEVLRNMRTGEILPPNATVPVSKREMLLLISDKVQLPAPAKVEIDGQSVVGIPAEESKAYKYSALVFDQYGDTMEGEDVTYALAAPVNGVNILDDGNLIVQPDAAPNQKVTITATSGSATGSLEILLASSGSTPTDIEILGTNILAIPENGSSEYQYEAVVTDNVGGVVKGQRIVWSILDSVEGVSIDRSTGKVVFDHTVPDGTVINVKAALDIDPSISYTKEIILLTAKATELVLVLPEHVIVDKGKGGEHEVIAYIADQQGEMFSTEGIKYELVEPVEGVSIDADSGLLVIDESVEEGTEIKVRALSSDPNISPKEASTTVQLNGPASISISGADSITVGSTAVTSKYTAEVMDSRGDVISASSEDGQVNWSVSGSSGVSINSDGLLTVQKGAKVGTVSVVATSVVNNEIVEEKQVSIKHPIDWNTGGGNSGIGGGGNSGSGNGSGNPTNTAPPIDNNPDQKFDDVPDSHWAAKDIEELVKLGAINGKSDNIFEPEADITRAEFVKILVNALGLKADVSSNNFRDVSENDWYYDSVMIASTLGIVNGVAEDEFAPHQNITREQMAAMLYRTLTVMEVEIENVSDNPFRDFDEISEFARQAVLSLQNISIINGVTEDTFAPKDYATRAQAAALINRLYKFVQNV